MDFYLFTQLILQAIALLFKNVPPLPVLMTKIIPSPKRESVGVRFKELSTTSDLVNLTSGKYYITDATNKCLYTFHNHPRDGVVCDPIRTIAWVRSYWPWQIETSSTDSSVVVSFTSSSPRLTTRPLDWAEDLILPRPFFQWTGEYNVILAKHTQEDDDSNELFDNCYIFQSKYSTQYYMGIDDDDGIIDTRSFFKATHFCLYPDDREGLELLEAQQMTHIHERASGRASPGQLKVRLIRKLHFNRLTQ